jgi:hypothetical protein
MHGESCGTCGGDGRVGNSLGGSTATCPSCHGSGRRAELSPAFHDVTKTKPSHYASTVVQPATGPRVAVTPEGVQLAREVAASTLGTDAKARLTAEIVQHESEHGRCTKTFLKKVHKQLKPAG